MSEEIEKCPICGSKILSLERRINGFATCVACGCKWKREFKQQPKRTIEVAECLNDTDCGGKRYLFNITACALTDQDEILCDLELIKGDKCPYRKITKFREV